jgi:hypothetical protein
MKVFLVGVSDVSTDVSADTSFFFEGYVVVVRRRRDRVWRTETEDKTSASRWTI